MQKFIWLWKHRHCWKQLKYLYEQRIELKRILRSIHINVDAPSEFQADLEKDPQVIDAILERLREFDRIPLARPWKVSPPISRRGLGIVYPLGRIPRCRNRPVPKQRDVQ